MTYTAALLKFWSVIDKNAVAAAPSLSSTPQTCLFIDRSIPLSGDWRAPPLPSCRADCDDVPQSKRDDE